MIVRLGNFVALLLVASAAGQPTLVWNPTSSSFGLSLIAWEPGVLALKFAELTADGTPGPFIRLASTPTTGNSSSLLAMATFADVRSTVEFSKAAGEYCVTASLTPPAMQAYFVTPSAAPGGSASVSGPLHVGDATALNSSFAPQYGGDISARAGSDGCWRWAYPVHEPPSYLNLTLATSCDHATVRHTPLGSIYNSNRRPAPALMELEVGRHMVWNDNGQVVTVDDDGRVLQGFTDATAYKEVLGKVVPLVTRGDGVAYVTYLAGDNQGLAALKPLAP